MISENKADSIFTERDNDLFMSFKLTVNSNNKAINR